jgi:hypothetical protein
MCSFKIAPRRTTSCIVHCQALCYLASRPQNCQLYYASDKKTIYCLLRLSPAFSRVYLLPVLWRIRRNTISRRMRERFTKYNISPSAREAHEIPISRRLRERFTKYDISPSAREVHEIRYLDITG